MGRVVSEDPKRYNNPHLRPVAEPSPLKNDLQGGPNSLC